MKTLRIAMMASLVVTGACGGTQGGTGGGGTGGTGVTGSGAPPSGFTTVIPASDGNVGAYTAVAKDANGDPLVAYVWEYPMGQTADKSILQFVRWDRSAAAFTAPVTLDTVGDQGFSAPERGVGIAFDPATKEIAVVYQREDYPQGSNPIHRIYLITSTDMGKTWSAPGLVVPPQMADEGSAAPSVAIRGSEVWVSYQLDNYQCCPQASCGSCSGEWVAHSTDGGASFTYEIVQVGGVPAQSISASPSELRLDASGQPGLVFMADDPVVSYNRQVVYYRVGAPGGAVVAFDSSGIQNDSPSASLAYDGVKPRVVAHLVADSAADYDMRFSASDDGVTWTAPEKLPRDGNDYTAWYQSLSIGSKGQAAVAAYINGGSGNSTCGGPRLLRSADLTAWSACGADTTKQVAVNGSWVQIYHGPDDKLSMVTTGLLTPADSKSGLLFWREP